MQRSDRCHQESVRPLSCLFFRLSQEKKKIQQHGLSLFVELLISSLYGWKLVKPKRLPCLGTILKMMTLKLKFRFWIGFDLHFHYFRYSNPASCHKNVVPDSQGVFDYVVPHIKAFGYLQ